MRFKIHCFFGILFALGLLISCASMDRRSMQHYDPLEHFNRKIFDFNYYILDRYVLHPVAIVWRNYLPIQARNGFSNFLSNLEEPTSMVNNFLRGDVNEGVKNFNRFFINSIFGMAGFIDIATMANPNLSKKKISRFGSTLGYYHVGYGPYLVLPGYGSFTLREDGGNWVDKFYPMLSYLNFWMSFGKWLLEGIEKRALLLDFDGVLEISSDRYLTIRETYFQNKDLEAQGNVLEPKINFNIALIEENLDVID